MKNSGLILGVMLSVGLVGCGGGSGGGTSSDNSNSNDNSQTTEQVQSFEWDGIYISPTGFRFAMIIDSKRPKNKLIVGEFARKRIFYADTVTTTENSLMGKGLNMFYQDKYDTFSEEVINIDFYTHTVTISMAHAGETSINQVSKAPASLTVDEIVGTHTNRNDGSTWEISADSTFVVNGECTITGKLVRNGDYFNISNATAVACGDPSLNGTYNGVFTTFKNHHNTHIGGILWNESGILFGEAPKN